MYIHGLGHAFLSTFSFKRYINQQADFRRSSQARKWTKKMTFPNKIIFFLKNISPLIPSVDINSVFAVDRVLQKTYLKTREGEILIMFDLGTKDIGPRNVPQRSWSRRCEVFVWSSPTLRGTHSFISPVVAVFSCKYCHECVYSLTKQSFDVNVLVSSVIWCQSDPLMQLTDLLKWPNAQRQQ